MANTNTNVPQFRSIQTTCVCNGAGRYVVATKEHLGPDLVSSSFATHPCVCRKELPRREGKASWWTTETVFREQALALCDPIEVSVSPEVPMSEDNFPLVRRGNRYWPTLVEVTDGDNRFTMHPDEARKLAQHLIKAAEVADGIDHADVDKCGHWAPCDCGEVKATV